MNNWSLLFEVTPLPEMPSVGRDVMVCLRLVNADSSGRPPETLELTESHHWRGMEAQAYNLNTWKAEARGSENQDLPGL